jgi:hypothetical protein
MGDKINSLLIKTNGVTLNPDIIHKVVTSFARAFF